MAKWQIVFSALQVIIRMKNTKCLIRVISDSAYSVGLGCTKAVMLNI